MRRTLLSTQVINLAPGSEVELEFPLSQGLLGGDQRIGTYVAIEHPHDSQLVNNQGSQIIYGTFTLAVGRNPKFQFPVLNQSPAGRQISLSVMPNDLAAAVTPGVRHYDPWEQIQAELELTVPDSIHGTPGADVRREITVVARGPNGSLIDGLTQILRIDN